MATLVVEAVAGVSVDAFTMVARRNVSASWFVVTSARRHAVKIALHARGNVKTDACIASVNVDVVNHVCHVLSLAAGSVHISSAPSFVRNHVTDLDVTSHAQNTCSVATAVLDCVASRVRRSAEHVTKMKSLEFSLEQRMNLMLDLFN